MDTKKLIANKSAIELSPWAKFCMSIAGYRFYDGNKMVSKHRLFTIASKEFNFSTFSHINDDVKLRDYLQTKFTMQNADGWENGCYRLSWSRDNYGSLVETEID